MPPMRRWNRGRYAGSTRAQPGVRPRRNPPMTPTPLRIEPPARLSRVPFAASIPGSKSITNRALVLAAMRTGTTAIAGGLQSDDTLALARALGQFAGLRVEATADGFLVARSAPRLRAPEAALH